MVQSRQIGLFIVGFISPPLAVVIARNQIDSIFWLNLLLTLLAWLPGVVHAYWVLLTRNPLADEDWAGYHYQALTRPGGGYV